MKKLIFLFFIFYIKNISAQTSPYYPTTPSSGDVLLATPEVSAFQRYNFNSVNLYTGKVDVSIPLYEIKTGGLSVPISITYNSSGIKVDEIASSVGIGWNLNVGGSVLRTIKDIDDNEIEFSASTITTGWITDEYTGQIIIDPNRQTYVSKKGYLTEYSDLALTNPPLSLPNGVGTKTDASPDLFITNAPGLNAKFFLTNLDRGTPTNFQNNVSTYSMKFLDMNGTKGNIVTRKRLSNVLPANGFDFNQGLTPMDYEKFDMVNTEGIKYSFGSPDISESLPSFYSPLMLIPKVIWGINTLSSNGQTNLILARGLYRLKVSAWNLDRIEDPRTNRSINYTYEKYNKPEKITYRTNMQTALLNNAMPFLGGSNSYPGNQKCTYDFIPDYMTPSQPGQPATPDECFVKNAYLFVKYPQSNRVQEITWDNGKVKFYYDMARQDALGEKALTKVEVIVNDKIIKTYFLNYSYFISKENCNDWVCKRLKLESIDIKGSKEVQSSRYYTLDYYYDNPLPKVNSLQQDFLGYYNNHGVEQDPLEMHIHPQIIRSPKLYFDSYSGKDAIRPFPDAGGVLIPGDYSLESNEYSLTGLLKKITNPLGGFSEFEYENHEFKYFSNRVKAGGARIKSQILNDGKKESYLYYTYEEGKIINLPTFGYPLATDVTRKNDPDNTSFIVYTTNRADLQLTNGAYIGYSTVIEKEESKGYTEYEFSNKENEDVKHISPIPAYFTCENFLHSNSSFGNNIFIDNNILRGNLLSKKVYNNNNNILLEKKNFYTQKVAEEISIPFQQTLFQPQHTYTSSGPNVGGMAIYNYINKLRVERNLLTLTETREFLTSAIIGTSDNFEYDPTYPFIKKEKKRLPNQNSYIEKKYIYPHELGDQPMINSNVLSLPVGIEESLVEKNDYSDPGISTLQNKSTLIFSKNANTSNLLQSTIMKKHDLNGIENIVYTNDKYDGKGNLLQYTTKGGISTVFIWGYKRLLPIAKIEGITYDVLMNNFGLNPDPEAYLNLDIVKKSNQDVDAASENILISSLDAFRVTVNNLGANITTYTHNPGIGITSIKDNSGFINNYEYNGKNDLSKILNDNKIVKEVIYNKTPLHLQTIYFNRKQEQLFTRNNCPVGYSGGDYNYIVPAEKYLSQISLSDANQMALNDIQLHGQNTANISGTCTSMICPFIPLQNLNSVVANVSRTSDVDVNVHITIPIANNSNLNWQAFGVGDIKESCTALYNNVAYASENGRTWTILLTNTGRVILMLTGGNIGSSGSIDLNFQYNKTQSNSL